MLQPVEAEGVTFKGLLQGSKRLIFPDSTPIKLRNCYFITVSSSTMEAFVPLQDSLSPGQAQFGSGRNWR